MKESLQPQKNLDNLRENASDAFLCCGVVVRLGKSLNIKDFDY